MRNIFQEQFKQEAGLLQVHRDHVKATARKWTFSPVGYLSSDIAPATAGVFYAGAYDGNEQLIAVLHFNVDFTALAEAQKSPNIDSLPKENLIVEEFISYENGRMTVSRFYGGKLRGLHKVQRQDRHIIERQFIEGDFYGHSRWDYENGRCKRLQILSDDGSRVTSEIEYGPNGEQKIYRVRRDGTRFEMGQGLPRGVTAESIKETIRTRLVEMVPRLVASTNITEPIYCVALAYDGEGNDVLPPTIGIGLESERQTSLTSANKEDRQRIWNPAEFNYYEKPETQFDDEKLEEVCNQLNDYLADRDSTKPGVKLLIEIATELNKASWPPSINRTKDFVVYAVDFELAALRRNLKASLLPEQFAGLKLSKLI